VDERSKEKTFETDVIKHLLTQGWIEGHSNGYDKAHALYPEDAVDWIRETQPDQWDKLNKDGNGVSKLIAAISRNLDKKGSLHVLRNVIKDVSIKLEMAQFRPGHNLNPPTGSQVCPEPTPHRPSAVLLPTQQEQHRPRSVPQRNPSGYL
jgi:type I restriction enzyme R subunit